MEVWRLVKSRRAASAFDGEGARLFGGRWNSVNTPMVYSSPSVSLAVLEILVHLENGTALAKYSLVRAEIPEELISALPATLLPTDWAQEPAPQSTKTLGDQWVRGNSSVGLVVPSGVVAREENVLFNPNHPDFRQVQIDRPAEFELDPRLVQA
jgi:RES domain-containing protein